MVWTELVSNRFLKSNTLHRSTEITDSRLKLITIELVEHYRVSNELKDDTNEEFYKELKEFHKRQNSIIEATTYYDYIKELYNLTLRKFPNDKLSKEANVFFICISFYLGYLQFISRCDVISGVIGGLDKLIENYNYNKLIQDYKKTENKELFKAEQKLYNATPYNQYELSKIEEVTGITTKTNMLFDEDFIVSHFNGLVEHLIQDLLEFKRMFQEVLLYRSEIQEPSELVERTLLTLNLDELLPNMLKLLDILGNLLNGATKEADVQIFINIEYTRKLTNDLTFLKNLSLINDTLDNTRKGLVDVTNNLTQNELILNHFKDQYDKTTDGSSVDKSLKQWLETDRFDFRNIKDITNLPGSLNHLQDDFLNTTSEFDDDFRDKYIGNLIDKIKDSSGLLKGLQDIINKNIGIIGAIIAAAIVGIKDLLQGILNTLKALWCVVKAVLCAIGKVVATIGSVLSKILPFLKNKGNLDNMVSNLQVLPGKIVAMATQQALKAYNEIKQTVLDSIQPVLGIIESEVGTDLKNIFQAKAFDAAMACGSESIKELTNSFLKTARETFSKEVTEAKEMLSGQSKVCPSLLGNLLPGMDFKLPSMRFNRPSFPKPSLQFGNC